MDWRTRPDCRDQETNGKKVEQEITEIAETDDESSVRSVCSCSIRPCFPIFDPPSSIHRSALIVLPSRLKVGKNSKGGNLNLKGGIPSLKGGMPESSFSCGFFEGGKRV